MSRIDSRGLRQGNAAARSISRPLTLRYVLSLGAIAVIVVSGQILVQLSLRQQESDARVINLAGRQRMLSQRIAKAAERAPSREQKAQLESSLKAFVRVHRGLQEGDRELGLPDGGNSPQVRRYFSNLSVHFDGLVAGVGALLDSEIRAEQRTAAQAQVRLHEAPFLHTMDLIAFRLDAEARDRVARVERIEIALMLLALAVLLFEALFIFRPGVKTIERTLSSLIRTRDELARIEADLQATMRAIPDGVARLTGDGQLLMLKAMPEGLLSTTGSKNGIINTDALPGPVGAALRAGREESRRDNVVSSRQVVLDGHSTAYEIRVAPSLGTGNVVMLRDITEKQRLEAEVLDAHERAQGRVGRELHDGLCQHLAGLALLARAQASTPEDEELVRLLDEGVTEARQLAQGLYPVTLANLGLSGALEEIIRHSETVSDLACNLEIDVEPIRLSNESALQLYRIAQEAAANVIKHANARNLWIRLREQDGSLCLEVQDDGQGLQLRKKKRYGLGLDSMSYRATLLNGELLVVTPETGGTMVRCRIPYGNAPKAPHPEPSAAEES